MNKKNSSLTEKLPILIGVPVVCILCMIASESDQFAGVLFILLVLAFVILCVSFCVGLYRSIMKGKMQNFLTKCEEQGIHKLTTEKEIQKATLIAQSLNLDSSNIQKLFEKANNHSQKTEEAKAKAALEDRKEEERELYSSWMQYSRYQGREKRIVMLKDARKKALKEAEDARMTNMVLRSMVTKSESNWAIAGGMVSGVAGPIAGALTAIDTEAKNILIREQNQENLKAMAPMLYSYSGSASAHEAQAKRIAEMIQDAKTKLISKDTPKDCLKHLQFSDIEISVSETGTCFVKVKASVPKALTIFGDTTAVVDGEIIASIYDKDKKLGSATLVLPTMGIPGKSSVDLVGICLFCGGNVKDKSYKLKFSTDNLWLMEQ